MIKIYRLAWRLVVALSCGLAAGSARTDEPMPEDLRSKAERLVLRGELSGLVRSPAYGRWLGLRSLPLPLNLWRIDIGWAARGDGTVGLAPPTSRHEALPWDPLGRHFEGWPTFQALAAERQMRETAGTRNLPEESPLARLPDPDSTIARFLDLQRSVYRPVPPEQSPDAAWAAAARASREQADSLRSTSHLWAALAAGLLLALTLLAGLLARPRP